MTRGRRRQALPRPNSYGMAPQFIHWLLATGQISPSAFVLWLTIRLFARDQERGKFSPLPVSLTNQQLASLMNLSEPQIKNLLAEIEKAHALLRRSIAGRRTLQLLEPENFAAVASQWIYRTTNCPPIDLPDKQLAGNWKEEEDISTDQKTLEAEKVKTEKPGTSKEDLPDY